VDNPWPVEHWRDCALPSRRRTVNSSLVSIPVPCFNDLRWTCCVFCGYHLHVSGFAALCHFYCCLAFLWVGSNMLDRGDKVTTISFRNFDVCIPYLCQMCTNLELRASLRLNFVRWRLILVGPEYATCSLAPFCRLEL
jgi:hypothetical protein